MLIRCNNYREKRVRGDHMKKYDLYGWGQALPSSFATISISIFLLLIYILGILIPPHSILITSFDILKVFGFSEEVLTGEIYRLITSILIHGNIVHLLTNILFLIIFGLRLEELKGPWIVYFIFIISGLIGNLGSLLWLFFGINFLSFGSSGSIFGLFGALIFILRGKSKGEQRKMLFLSIFFFSLTIGHNTNIISHVFGLVSGYCTMMGIKEKRRP